MEKSTINILSVYELWVKIPTDFLVKWTADNMIISFQWNKWYSFCKKKKKYNWRHHCQIGRILWQKKRLIFITVLFCNRNNFTSIVFQRGYFMFHWTSLKCAEMYYFQFIKKSFFFKKKGTCIVKNVSNLQM